MTTTTTEGVAGEPATPTDPQSNGISKVEKRRGRIGLAYVSPWIIGFLLFTAIPMVASLWFSFTDFNLVSDEPTKFIGLENWAKLFEDPNVRHSAWVTIKFGLLAMPLAIILPMGAAYLMIQPGLRFREGFRFLFYMPSVIPLVAAVLVFGGIFNGQTGWVNRALAVIGIDGPNWFNDEDWVYVGLLLIGTWGIGNAMIIFIASMNGVPQSLYDASKIDGAGTWAQFRHVTMPIVTPIIFYNLVIALIGLFNYFVVPFVLHNGTGDPNGATLFYAMYFFRVGFRLFDMGYASALAWALFVVAIAVTGLLFWSAKYWVHYEFDNS